MSPNPLEYLLDDSFLNYMATELQSIGKIKAASLFQRKESEIDNKCLSICAVLCLYGD
jgi:hypothetical protein